MIAAFIIPRGYRIKIRILPDGTEEITIEPVV